MIIGITGTLGAGKGTVVDYLKNKGFTHYSVREFLTEEVKKRGLPVNRDSMVLVGNQLREMFSPSYIIDQLFSKAKETRQDCIIESLRNPGEVEALKKKEDSFLIAVDALSQIRYSRIFKRQSETDNLTYQEFLENEKREMESTDPNKQNLKKCIEMADFVLTNDSSFENLYEQLEKIYRQINFKRPSWDEYFMKIMKEVGARTTCDRARKGGGGCVIVKDKQILVTGYVGSPPGISHCDEVGHQMKSTIHEDRSKSDHCVRTTHSEQNAICQAAKRGISLDGATLYVFMTPCYTCAKLIITAGIKRIVCEKAYHADKDSRDLLEQAGVKLEILKDEVTKYENQ
ncbi:deaminase [Nanoarchaeota archaeon]